MLLSDRYPFLANYFDRAISNKLNNKGVPIAHSLLFFGQDLESQLIFAKEIARQLNCTGDRTENCDCLNCRWIKEDRHPAVMLVTPKDNKPADDESKTVISVKQANMIKNSLLTTSDYFRVFIFFDRDKDGNVKGLNSLNFQEETANSMLKMIEEPNENVMFIFMANSKDDILPTIISRCQCFSVSNVGDTDYSYDNIQSIMGEYWNIKRSDVFDVAQKLETLAKHVDGTLILLELEYYIHNILRSNPENTWLINDLRQVEHARQEIGLGMSVGSVFESMCLKLIK